MSSFSRKPAPSREDAIERARREREARAAERRAASAAAAVEGKVAAIQALWRSVVVRLRVTAEQQSTLAQKLAGVDAIAKVMRARGKTFVPPTPALREMCGHALRCSWPAYFDGAAASCIERLFGYLLASCASGDAANNLLAQADAAAGGDPPAVLVRRLLQLAVRLVARLDLAPAARLAAAKFLHRAVCGRAPSSSAAAAGATVATTAASSAGRSARSHWFQARNPRFVATVVRPALLAMAPDAGCGRLMGLEAEKQVAWLLVDLCLQVLEDDAADCGRAASAGGVGAIGSGGGGGARAGATTRAPSDLHQLGPVLLCTPFLPARLTPAVVPTTEPEPAAAPATTAAATSGALSLLFARDAVRARTSERLLVQACKWLQAQPDDTLLPGVPCVRVLDALPAECLGVAVSSRKPLRSASGLATPLTAAATDATGMRLRRLLPRAMGGSGAAVTAAGGGASPLPATPGAPSMASPLRSGASTPASASSAAMGLFGISAAASAPGAGAASASSGLGMGATSSYSPFAGGSVFAGSEEVAAAAAARAAAVATGTVAAAPAAGATAIAPPLPTVHASSSSSAAGTARRALAVSTVLSMTVGRCAYPASAQRLLGQQLPGSLLLVANLAQLMCVEAAPTGAAAGRPLLHQPLLPSFFRPSSLARLMTVISTCIEALPDDVWATATPLLWLTPSSSPATGYVVTTSHTGGASPVALPGLLLLQLRCLSSERLAKSLAFAALAMNPAALTHPRTCGGRPDSDDPERGTYDETSVDVRAAAVMGSGLGAATGGATAASTGGSSSGGGIGGFFGRLLGRDASSTSTAGSGGGTAAGVSSAAGAAAGGAAAAGSSTLAAEPGLVAGALRALWNTSRLALRLPSLKRVGDGVDGSSIVRAALADDDEELASASAAAAVAASRHARGAATDEDDEEDDDGIELRRLLPAAGFVAPVAAAPAPAARLPSAAFDVPTAYAFTRLYAFLVAPRPTYASAGSAAVAAPAWAAVTPGGHIGGAGTALPQIAAPDSEPLVGRIYLLNALAYSPSLQLCKRLWWLLLETVTDTGVLLHTCGYKATARAAGPMGLLALFATALRHVATVADELEMYSPDGHVPMPLRELRHAIVLLRDAVAHAEGIGVDVGAASATGGAISAGSASRLVVSRSVLLPAAADASSAAAATLTAGVAPPIASTSPYTEWLASANADDAESTVSRRLVQPPSTFWPRFAHAAVQALRTLYDRHSQRPLGPQALWLIDTHKATLELASYASTQAESSRAFELSGGVAVSAMTRNERREEAKRRLLVAMSFALPFDVRAGLYWSMRDADRYEHQTGRPQVQITVRRSRLFESCFDALKDVRGDLLRRKIYVTFVNNEGMWEAGIDAGGLFKELWTSLAAIVFDPSYGLFKVTDDGNAFIYPNPDSGLCSGFDDVVAFEWLGRVLGKAMYEGITIGPQFAPFFLHKLLGHAVHIHHLPTLDKELYRSLMFLKTYAGNVEEDLSLTWTVSSDLGGAGAAGGAERELVPGGASLPVTNANRLQYIHAVADWRLNKSIERQTNAFLRGLRDVIPLSWLQGFSAPELQVLISGTPTGIDVADMRRYTQYSGGYHAASRVIDRFWRVVEGLSDRDRSDLLRFVTSCGRAPPTGFVQLQPAFTIQQLPCGSPDDTLPMASTCFNVLKLPAYSSEAKLREKLLLAIRSGAGFEMS